MIFTSKPNSRSLHGVNSNPVSGNNGGLIGELQNTTWSDSSSPSPVLYSSAVFSGKSDRRQTVPANSQPLSEPCTLQFFSSASTTAPQSNRSCRRRGQFSTERKPPECTQHYHTLFLKCSSKSHTCSSSQRTSVL